MQGSDKTLRVGVQLVLDNNSARQLQGQVQRALQTNPQVQGRTNGLMGLLSNPQQAARQFSQNFAESIRATEQQFRGLDRQLISIEDRLKSIARIGRPALGSGTGSSMPPGRSPNGFGFGGPTVAGQGLFDRMMAQSVVPPALSRTGPYGSGYGRGQTVTGYGSGGYGPGGPGGGNGPNNSGGGSIPGAYAAQIETKVKLDASDIAIMAGAIGNAVGRSMAQLAGLAQSYKTMEGGNVARAMQASTGSFFRDAMTGVSSDTYFMRQMKGVGGATVANNVTDTASGRTAIGVGWAGQALAALSGAVGAGGAGSKVGGAGGVKGGGLAGAALALPGLIGAGANIAASATSQEARADEAETMRRALENAKAASPMTMAVIDQLRGEKFMRARAERTMGFDPYGAYGYGRGEVAGIGEGISRQVGRGGLLSDHLLNNTLKMGFGGISESAASGGLGGVYSALGGAGHGSEAMRALEEAVARGTSRGFADPRTSEELVSAMGQASRGRVLDNADGLQALMGFLTGGTGGRNMSVAETEARRGAFQGFENLEKNPFYQGVYAAQAKGLLGSGGTGAQLMGLSGASMTDLFTGGQWAKDLGIDKHTRFQAIQQRLQADLMTNAPSFGIDPQAAMNDPRLQRTIFRGMKSFGTDQTAKAAQEMLGTPIGQLEGMSDKQLKSAFGSFGGPGSAAVSQEEAMKSMLDASQQMKEVVSNIGKDMQNLPQMLQEALTGEKAGTQYNDGSSPEKGLWVKVAGGNDAPMLQPTPSSARSSSSEESRLKALREKNSRKK